MLPLLSVIEVLLLGAGSRERFSSSRRNTRNSRRSIRILLQRRSNSRGLQDCWRE